MPRMGLATISKAVKATAAKASSARMVRHIRRPRIGPSSTNILQNTKASRRMKKTRIDARKRFISGNPPREV